MMTFWAVLAPSPLAIIALALSTGSRAGLSLGVAVFLVARC
jgi:hypothetical protein